MRFNEAFSDAFTAIRTLNLEFSRTPKEIIPVKYHVDTVFRHAETGFNGVIKRVDEVCDQDETWIAINNIDQLEFGRYQPFYLCLMNFGTGSYQRSYVAQQFIEPSNHLSISLLPSIKQVEVTEKKDDSSPENSQESKET